MGNSNSACQNTNLNRCIVYNLLPFDPKNQEILDVLETNGITFSRINKNVLFWSPLIGINGDNCTYDEINWNNGECPFYILSLPTNCKFHQKTSNNKEYYLSNGENLLLTINVQMDGKKFMGSCQLAKDC